MAQGSGSVCVNDGDAELHTLATTTPHRTGEKEMTSVEKKMYAAAATVYTVRSG